MNFGASSGPPGRNPRYHRLLALDQVKHGSERSLTCSKRLSSLSLQFGTLDLELLQHNNNQPRNTRPAHDRSTYLANINRIPILPIPIPSLGTVLPISTPRRCSAFQILKSGSHNRSNLHRPRNNFIVELLSYCAFHNWESDGDDGRLDLNAEHPGHPDLL